MAGIASSAALCQQQPAAAPLAFEVATIKPSEPITGMGKVMMRIGVDNDGALVTYSRMSLRSLVVNAYGVKDYQVTSAASWMDTQQFDISAKLPDGATKDQAPAMLQTLLRERFKITLHSEKKDHPIYGLVAPKGSGKLKVADPNNDFPQPAGFPGGPPPPPPPGGGAVAFGSSGRMPDGAAPRPNSDDGRTMMRMGPSGGHIETRGMTMTKLAETLSQYVDRPVMNETNIDGKYDFSFDISTEDMRNVKMGGGGGMMVMARTMAGGGPAPQGAEAPANAPEGGSIFQSIQSYGLKLEPKKAPMDMIAIDSAEKTPTEN
jgi:uncharacterized protein (TIGR03435 family)